MDCLRPPCEMLHVSAILAYKRLTQEDGEFKSQPKLYSEILSQKKKKKKKGEGSKEGTHLGLRVPKEPSAAGGGAAIACPAGNVALALERRQGDVEVG